ncbi:ABC transporter permease [candidate division KSB1 bacterium]
MTEKQKKPPRFGEFILSLLSKPGEEFSSKGDFEELYNDYKINRGSFNAGFWYWKQIIRSLPLLIAKNILRNIIMFKNYLKIAFRNLFRQKIFSFINILGLSIGLTGSFIILLYILYETSFDKYHSKADQIYRIISKTKNSDYYYSGTPYLLTPELSGSIPGIQKTARLIKGEALVQRENSKFLERNFGKADPEIFEIFDFPFLVGDPATALKDPNSIVLTETTAKKYFGDEEPMGKMLTMRIRRGTKLDVTPHSMRVTGIIEDFRSNSHFSVDFFIPVSSVNWGYENIKRAIPYFKSWSSLSFYTYILTDEGSDPAAIEASLSDIIRPTPTYREYYSFTLQPLINIHLNNIEIVFDIESQGSMFKIYVFSIIAFLLLVIALINYMILSTARSSIRSKEVGIRKVVGAQRSDLVKQIIIESILISYIALPISVIFAGFVIPHVNRLLETGIRIEQFYNWDFITAFLGLTLLAGLISGAYISLVLSRSHPLHVLKSKINTGVSRSYFRNSLIVFQMTVFAALIVGSIVMYKQIRYLTVEKDLGFDKEDVISIHLNDRAFEGKYKIFRDEARKNPIIKYVTSSYADPPANMIRTSAVRAVRHPDTGEIYGFHSWTHDNVSDPSDLIIIDSGSVDYDYPEAVGLRLIAGRTFDRNKPFTRKEIIVNETFLKERNIENPIGQTIRVIDEDLRIIGVVKDFHTHSLYQKINPLKLRLGTQYIQQIIVKTEPGKTREAIVFMEEVWNRISPESPFEYSFLEETLETIYDREDKFGEAIGYFTYLAIFIACLGLFGLTLFISEQRRQEIGIRKVLGSSAYGIVRLITNEFIFLVLIANIAAFPIGWFVMHKWLENFAYRITIEWQIFAFAFGLSFGIALLTVSFHSLKAAAANPVNSLRYE